MWTRILIVGLLLLGLSGAARAQSALEREPGYVDLRLVESWFDAEPMIEVNIKGALLRLVAEASRYEDPELARLLYKLKALQVRGFSLRGANYREVERQTAGLARILEDEGWDTVVRVREYDDDERVDVYVKVDDDRIAGMMVMVLDTDEDESFFVNIVGDIDPEQIGRIGRKFDIGPLDDVVVDY